MGALFSSSRGAATTMATKFVNDTIASDKVVIFSKSHCPYCTMAKEVRKTTMHHFFFSESSGWYQVNYKFHLFAAIQ